MKKRTSVSTYGYLLPSTVIMAVILGFPIIYNIAISFFKWTLMSNDKPFIGLENYAKILGDDKFLKILLVTVIWTALNIALQMILGIGLALFTDHLTHGKKYMRMILMIPWIIPGTVTALTWKWMLQADIGIVNYLLMALGITGKNILFLSDKNIALLVLITINVWKATPFWFLMISAGLQDKPTDQVESARMDGAKYPHIVRYVLLPHLSPVIGSTGILTTIWTLNYFDLIWLATKGGPMDATSTLSIYTYRLAFEFNNFGQSAAMAVISLILVTIVCIPYVRRMFRNMKYEGVL